MSHDDLVKRLRDRSQMEDRFGFKVSSKVFAEAADAIERLSAEKAALHKANLAWMEACRVAQKNLDEQEVRIAELESGQPVEVRGEMWQLVRVEPSEADKKHTGEFIRAAVQDKRSLTDIALIAYRNYLRLSLTASAQEAQEDKT